MRELNIDTWERKDHFNFFKNFDDPFFSLVFNVDCTLARKYSKENNISFFLCYLYLALKAANEIKNFRYRLHENKVVIHDKINASPTINRPDSTFGFSYIFYEENFKLFLEKAEAEIKRVQNSTGLEPATNNENVIHFSTIPWISFTGLTHARHFAYKDSIPKISFGKTFTEDKKLMMPVSVTVNHALVDGYHVGQFYGHFQQLLNDFAGK